MLQCYTCYNVTESASESVEKGSPRNLIGFGIKYRGVFGKISSPPIIGILMERQATEIYPNFAMSIK